MKSTTPSLRIVSKLCLMGLLLLEVSTSYAQLTTTCGQIERLSQADQEGNRSITLKTESGLVALNQTCPVLYEMSPEENQRVYSFYKENLLHVCFLAQEGRCQWHPVSVEN